MNLYLSISILRQVETGVLMASLPILYHVQSRGMKQTDTCSPHPALKIYQRVHVGIRHTLRNPELETWYTKALTSVSFILMFGAR